ncbi:DNA mismatch repair protein MutL [Periconia macrospinosa]|uniref:DNA mismatch repair protein MutL n=1 Tax=Periconia macrospinosa TaxID=97972 RepID=A0A2V1EDY0_9PLEO|nr:DNA mismatch repair protein MutL [Periconia macrospinosa]
MATIKPIEGRSVHQIQSGQVIVDLNSVCKELVENSLDAGATSIEVRFRNNGLDAIEVQDNGSGISPEDYDTIALKHYTSKLSTYNDLSSLNTFGFRGEALSSLCALSRFHIITARASDGAKGTKLEFEQSGKLKGTSVVAAKQGSTVVVESLFHNLPVRRKELEKSIKREHGKVLQLLQAYACISVGVKFNVSNQMPKGKKTVAFSTNTNPNTKENIANVYGAKTLLALVTLDLKFEMSSSNRSSATQIVQSQNTQANSGSRTVRIVGHISRPVVGEGRQTPDRQMFFVNSRPCTLPQVAKAFNEVYKTYNITQSPFIFADIKLDTNAYDVNVSPDKRTIMLHDQTALLENLKEALVDLFDSHDQSVPQSQLLAKRTPSIATFKVTTGQQRDNGELDAQERSSSLQPPVTRKHSSPVLEKDHTSSSSSDRPHTGFIKASLIERFAGRDAEERPGQKPAQQRKRAASAADSHVLAEEEVAHSSLRSGTPSSDKADTLQESNRGSASPLFEPEREVSSTTDQSEHVPQAVKDFNARMESLHAESPARDGIPRLVDPERADKNEESISAIKQTPQKHLSENTIQNAFDRMRPMRTPTQQATITVGDTTTVSTVGNSGESRAAKRARIHTPKYGLNGTPLSQTPKRGLFFQSLRGFAAPGTQMEDTDEEDEGLEEVESSMPAGPARSPSPTKRRVPEFEGPRPDDFAESSSVPAPPGTLAHAAGHSIAEEPIDDESSDGEYVDEDEKKAREEARIAKSIAEAEEAAARPTEVNLKRAEKLSKVSQTKYRTTNLERSIETKISSIEKQIHNLTAALGDADAKGEIASKRHTLVSNTQLQKEDAEERLSLTVSKPDFNAMRIIGQFNLGFILTVRPPTSTSPSSELFIIDQHASDEKYNFERLSASTVLVPQRLVHPHPLELTAVEEEIILNHEASLAANGFKVDIDTSGEKSVGHRAALTSLPMSKEVTFTPKDLEELLALILDNPPPLASTSTTSAPTSPSSSPSSPDSHPLTKPTSTLSTYTPRPSKVRKLLASRACRSSVMIGKTLKTTQMENIVRHMGSMDKPWSCPHGRPTMRHMFGLDKWEAWTEGDGVSGLGEVGMSVDWGEWARERRGGMEDE